MYPHFELLNVVQPPVELRPVSRGPVNEITTLPVSELSLRITASPDPLLVLRPAISMVVVHWPADAMFVSTCCDRPSAFPIALPFEISSTVKLRLRDVTILVVTDEPAMLCVLDNEPCIDFGHRHLADPVLLTALRLLLAVAFKAKQRQLPRNV